MADAAMRKQERQDKAARKNAAFTAFLMGAGGDKKWRDFCVYLGLSEKEARSKERKREEIKYVYDMASAAIDAIDKGKK